MSSLIDKFQEILTAVSRLSDLEKRHSEAIKLLREDLHKANDGLASLNTRLTVLEVKFEGLKGQILTEASSAAQNAATGAVASKLMEIGERLARLEGPSAPRLAPRGKGPPTLDGETI